MALNLKKELLNGDGIVPSCSSDESGSDCSSEELIDCDVIVDVTKVATQIDECIHRRHFCKACVWTNNWRSEAQKS